MKTTIDVAGRLKIPQEIRREARLEPGMVLDVRLRDGRIEIEPVAASVRLVQKGRLLVAVPETEIEELSAGTVEETWGVLIDERAQEP